MAITKHIRAILSVLVVLPILTSCGTSALTARSTFRDDLYQSHDRELLAAAEQEATARTQAERAEREKRLRNIMSQATDVAEIYEGETEIDPYGEILIEGYEGEYERRLRGFDSPTYNKPSNSYNLIYGDDYKYAVAYDPSYYNVTVRGDNVLLEPKYVTSTFGAWSRPSFGLSIGSWGWGFNWGWDYHYPWYGWGYSPYWDSHYWHSSYYWPYHWGYGHHPRYYYGGRYNPHWDWGYWGGGNWSGSTRYYRDNNTHWKNTPTSGGRNSNRGYVSSSVSSSASASGRTSHSNRSSGVYRRSIESDRNSGYTGSSGTYTRGSVRNSGNTSHGNVGTSSGNSRQSGLSNRAGRSPSVNTGTSSRSSQSTPTYNSGSSSSGSSSSGASRGSGSSRGGSSGGSSSGRTR